MFDFGNHILVPVDFSDGSTHALRVAAGLRARLGAGGGRLTALHVVERPDPPPGFPDEVRAFLEREEVLAHGEVARFARDALSPESEATALVRYGTPADQIIAAAREGEAGLIVMGTHGRSGLPRLVLGSVAEAVVHAAPCAVLTVSRAASIAPAEAGGGPAPLACDSILVSTDLSEASCVAEDLALRLASAVGAELHVVHVAEGKGWGDGAIDQLVQAKTQVRSAVERLQRRARGGNGPSASTIIVEHPRTGSAAAEISACAEQIGAGLIIIASHGDGGIARKILGSTTDRVIRTASCPVLTARELGATPVAAPMEQRVSASATPPEVDA